MWSGVAEHLDQNGLGGGGRRIRSLGPSREGVTRLGTGEGFATGGELPAPPQEGDAFRTGLLAFLGCTLPRDRATRPQGGPAVRIPFAPAASLSREGAHSRCALDCGRSVNLPKPSRRCHSRTSAGLSCGSAATSNWDDLHLSHWITSSALASIVGEIVRPSAFAVLRFTVRLNLRGGSIGTAAGLAPLRIRSTKPAARRNRSP
jgi:hypothetical protein